MMTDDTSSPIAAHNQPVFSVGEISTALKLTVEETFGHVRVRGEISGFKRAASGHLYFALKDSEAVLDGVCWRGSAGRLGLEPEDGMEVIATGRLTTYGARSKYQIVVERMELAGEGALLKLLEDRRKKLSGEGLFDEEDKQPLPFLPDRIGIVTSPTGAVIRDILHRLSDRFPRNVLVWPVRVQGEGAAEEVAGAIRGFNDLAKSGPASKPDLIIVARGGGSLEDLWAFNEEIVVRAAAGSEIPLVSAVGHETDWTLVDYAADVRAPTPTAAAEMAVPVRHELTAQIMDDGVRLISAVSRHLREKRSAVDGLSRGLPDPKRILEDGLQRLDDWSERLGNSLGRGLAARRQDVATATGALRPPKQRIEAGQDRMWVEARALSRAMESTIKDRRSRLSQAGSLLESFSYERVLERGFALVSDPDGGSVTSADQISAGDQVEVHFHDGSHPMTVDGGGRPTKRPAKKPSKPKSPDDRQGSLL